MELVNRLKNGEGCIGVIGLGYVGLPLAVAFARKVSTIGFDMNAEKIGQYLLGHDVTQEIGDEELKASKCHFTTAENELDKACFLLVAVPTPITNDKTPDLQPIISASEVVGRHLKRGDIVVYESTVYPGVTQDICAAILEKMSGLRCGPDFQIGYSPERINPGDKVHRLNNIQKIVSGMDEATLNTIASVYELIIDAGVHRAESILVAEAAKVVENAQRDINIAFMNELAMVFDRMNIDTNSVVRAMNTKWNALGFTPGLVGGHCIGVDPYYFVYRAQQLGYHSQIISAGRRVNDGMGEFIAEKVVLQMIRADKKVKGAKVALLGITFKENCPDVRNTRVVDIMHHLEQLDIQIQVVDPMANADEAKREYGIDLQPMESIHDVDAVVVAVAHEPFVALDPKELGAVQRGTPVLVDVKSIYSSAEAEAMGFQYWSL